MQAGIDGGNARWNLQCQLSSWQAWEREGPGHDAIIHLHLWVGKAKSLPTFSTWGRQKGPASILVGEGPDRASWQRLSTFTAADNASGDGEGVSWGGGGVPSRRQKSESDSGANCRQVEN